MHSERSACRPLTRDVKRKERISTAVSESSVPPSISADAKDTEGAPPAPDVLADTPQAPAAQPSEQLQERRESNAAAAPLTPAEDGTAAPSDTSRPSGTAEEAPAASTSPSAEEAAVATPAGESAAATPVEDAGGTEGMQAERDSATGASDGHAESAGVESAAAAESIPGEDAAQRAEEGEASGSGGAENPEESTAPVTIPASLRPQLAQWMARAVQRVQEHAAAAHAAAKLHGGAKGVSNLLLPGLVRASKRYRGRLPWLRPVRSSFASFCPLLDILHAGQDSLTHFKFLC